MVRAEPHADLKNIAASRRTKFSKGVDVGLEQIATLSLRRIRLRRSASQIEILSASRRVPELVYRLLYCIHGTTRVRCRTVHGMPQTFQMRTLARRAALQWCHRKRPG